MATHPATLTSTARDPLRWIRDHVTDRGGIAVSARNRRPYPEVTGYLIPNLLQHGALGLARQFGAFLVQVQRPDGSFAGPDDERSYAFDTGQALRGLLALIDLPECRAAARRAADWLVATASADGRLRLPADLAAWDLGPRGRIPEAVHLYALPPLLRAAELLDEPKYAQAALRARDAYLRDPAALQFAQPNMLSHFFGYVHEALIDLGAPEVAAAAMAALLARQRADGAVPAYHDVDWICLPGQLQAAILLRKLGMHSAADRTLAFAERVQRDNGGFPGSVGPGAGYFADDEPSWAVKFWLDARPASKTPGTPTTRPTDRNLAPDEWHHSICGAAEAQQLADRVRNEPAPAWFQALLHTTRPGEHCLELGSGTGELSARLALAGRRVTLLDFSTASLDLAQELFRRLSLPAGFVHADVTQQLPFGDRIFDVVFSSGLLEHFEPDGIEHIVRESARIARRSVVALVPNSKSLPYRLGKQRQEADGTWTWGREVPFTTLRPQFEHAGLAAVREWTVAPEHALEFLTASDLQPMRRGIAAFYRGLAPDELAALDQGYLLVAQGDVAAQPATTPDSATPRRARLAVLPNDPLDAYVAAGYPDLTGYFNPAGTFAEVYCLSPHERRERRMYGMRVIPVTQEELPQLLRELGIDVVRAYCLPAGQFACRDKVPGVRYVVSVHDPDPERCPGPLPDADQFLAVSGRIEQFLRDKGADPARVRRLPNRVDPDVFRPIDDPKRAAAWRARFPGRHRILHVGRRSPEKNLETLIRALGQLGPDYVGICVGRGDPAPYAQLAQQVGATCHFVDAVPNHELAAWYSFADVMCTPSLWEGFGIVFLEAIAAGALVVTSDIAPMNEFLHHERNALLVQGHRDPAALAAMLQRACSDPALASRLRAAAPATAAPFAKATVDRLEAGIYAEQLAQVPARRHPPPTARSVPADDLPSSFRLHLRGADLQQDWDSIVGSSPDAWMFHRFAWQECQLQAFPLQDLSFLVEWEGRPVAVCPLQRHRHDPAVLHSTFMGTGGPALVGELAREQRAELLRLVHRVLQRFLQEGNARELRVLLPQLALSSRAHWASNSNPLVAHGYASTSSRTSLLDLSQDEATLFARLRHGHRQDIERARRLGIRVGRLHGEQGITDYYRLHQETYTRTGVPPHPEAYFRAIGRCIVAAGLADTFAAWHDDRLIAAANIAHHGDGSLYWTGAYAADALRTGAGKLLQWEVIRASKAAGRTWHETGEVFPGAETNSKVAGLTNYKIGFGGIVRPWFQGVLQRSELSP